MGSYIVVYASDTGNTRQIAQEIFEAIKEEPRQLVNIRDWNGAYDADVWFVGYRVNHSTCPIEIMDLLSSLHHKHVALFGTCGLDDSQHYYERLEKNASAFIGDDNDYYGAYYCRGKMPAEIRERYEELRGTYEDDVLDRMVASFDEALKHPDREDLLGAHLFVDKVFRTIGIRK